METIKPTIFGLKSTSRFPLLQQPNDISNSRTKKRPLGYSGDLSISAGTNSTLPAKKRRLDVIKNPTATTPKSHQGSKTKPSTRAKGSRQSQLPAQLQRPRAFDEKNVFTINETEKIPNKLKEYENTLCSYCVNLYNLCSNDTIKLSNELPEISYPPTTDTATTTTTTTNRDAHPTLGKTLRERHLAEALYHLEQALAIDVNVGEHSGDDLGDVKETKKMYRSLQQTSSKILDHLSTVTKAHVEANKVCKKSVSVFKKLSELMSDWDRWKIQYMSELRIHYDPTLCGGISKPTLDVFSAQSNASKMRLGVVERLASKRDELLKELQEVDQQLSSTTQTSPMVTDTDITAADEANVSKLMKRKTKVTKDLLEVTASSMEILRSEREVHYLDTRDQIASHISKKHKTPFLGKITGTMTTEDISKTYRWTKQQNVEVMASTLSQPTKGTLRTNDADETGWYEDEDEHEDKDKDNNCESNNNNAAETLPSTFEATGMPSLVASTRAPQKEKGGSRRKRSPDPPTLSPPQSHQKLPRINYGFNPVTQIDITWDNSSFDVPLEKVNWASKTTVRIPQNLILT